MFYVDQFGVLSDEKNNTFKDTALMLDYLQDLGVISAEVYICQRVTCFTEFSEKSPEFK
jgi:hypothetical protein